MSEKTQGWRDALEEIAFMTYDPWSNGARAGELAREALSHLSDAQKKEVASASAISGALYSFIGFLTSHETRRVFSANDWATPAVDALTEFAAKWGLSLDEPDIEGWHNTIATPPAAAEAPAVNTSESYERMRRALTIIANWTLPETGEYWDAEKTRPVSFEYNYGSNGERDYMQNLAAQALLARVVVDSIKSTPTDSAVNAGAVKQAIQEGYDEYDRRLKNPLAPQSARQADSSDFDDSAMPYVKRVPRKADSSEARAFADIAEERKRQDEQWGGPEHDDEHSEYAFLVFINYQYRHAYGSANPPFRERFVKIAALAVAAIESIDRKEGKS